MGKAGHGGDRATRRIHSLINAESTRTEGVRGGASIPSQHIGGTRPITVRMSSPRPRAGNIVRMFAGVRITECQRASYRLPTTPMQQQQEDSAPTVRIRDLSTNSVDFVLENVDMAFANSLRRVMMADLPTVGMSPPSPVIQFTQTVSKPSTSSSSSQIQVYCLMNTLPIVSVSFHSSAQSAMKPFGTQECVDHLSLQQGRF